MGSASSTELWEDKCLEGDVLSSFIVTILADYMSLSRLHTTSSNYQIEHVISSTKLARVA